MFIAPMATNELLDQAYEWIASNLGAIYLIMGLLTLLFLLILAISKYGGIVLGREDDEPEYGFFGDYWLGNLLFPWSGGGL